MNDLIVRPKCAYSELGAKVRDKLRIQTNVDCYCRLPLYASRRRLILCTRAQRPVGPNDVVLCLASIYVPARKRAGHGIGMAYPSSTAQVALQKHNNRGEACILYPQLDAGPAWLQRASQSLWEEHLVVSWHTAAQRQQARKDAS